MTVPSPCPFGLKKLQHRRFGTSASAEAKCRHPNGTPGAPTGYKRPPGSQAMAGRAAELLLAHPRTRIQSRIGQRFCGGVKKTDAKRISIAEGDGARGWREFRTTSWCGRRLGFAHRKAAVVPCRSPQRYRSCKLPRRSIERLSQLDETGGSGRVHRCEKRRVRRDRPVSPDPSPDSYTSPPRQRSRPRVGRPQ